MTQMDRKTKRILTTVASMSLRFTRPFPYATPMKTRPATLKEAKMMELSPNRSILSPHSMESRMGAVMKNRINPRMNTNIAIDE